MAQLIKISALALLTETVSSSKQEAFLGEDANELSEEFSPEWKMQLLEAFRDHYVRRALQDAD